MQEQAISLDEVDQNGNSAVHVAAQYGHLGCLQVNVWFVVFYCYRILNRNFGKLCLAKYLFYGTVKLETGHRPPSCFPVCVDWPVISSPFHYSAGTGSVQKHKAQYHNDQKTSGGKKKIHLYRMFWLATEENLDSIVHKGDYTELKCVFLRSNCATYLSFII